MIITEDGVTRGLCENGIKIVVENNISFLIVTGYRKRIIEHSGWNRC